MDHLIDRFPVLYLGYVSLAGRLALVNVIIQARTLFADIPGKFPITRCV